MRKNLLFVLTILICGSILGLSVPCNALTVKEREEYRDYEYKYYKNLNPKFYAEELKQWYKSKTGEDLNLENPKTFNQKMQWLKLYDSTPIKTKLADKYLVREWVKEKIGEEYLIPILGVWDSFDEIDFDKLPNRFVLKTNHGSGWQTIVKDKNKFNKKLQKQRFDKWMNTNFAFVAGYELHYRDIKPKIIAEQFIEDPSGDLKDYKIMCFNGKPEFIWADVDRFHGHTRDIFDLNWNRLPFEVKCTRSNYEIEKPQNLDKMIELAKILCEGFPLVRVDLYSLPDGSIKFGEMTFTSGTGIESFSPGKYGEIYGDMITLPKEKYILN